MRFYIIIYILFTCLFSFSSQIISQIKCSDRMKELIIENPDTVIVQVKGLVCSSCGIGIRIGLAKIDGLDKNRFNKGVLLDSSNQYVLLAISGNIDFNMVFEKIYNAGYDPMHLCYTQGDQVIRVDAPQKNT